MTDQPEWPLAGNPDGAIGTRQHYIPRFYLARFANTQEQIRQVDRQSRKSVVANVKNCGAERDFNTYVNTDGKLDGRLEQLLTAIEDEAAPAIREACNPLVQFPLRPQVRSAICNLVAFQKSRGRATRRTVEALGDTMQKFTLRGLDRDAVIERLTVDGVKPQRANVDAAMAMIAELDQFEFVPDPNEHLALIGTSALRIYQILLARPMFIAEFADRVLFTCDEPVSLYRYKPDPLSGVGFLNADEIWFPLDPRRVLIFAKPGLSLTERRFHAEPQSARTINAMTAHNAYQYLFAHPDQSDSEIEVPEAAPLFKIDGALTYEADVRSTRTQRRRR